VEDGSQQAVCPRCGGTAEVRTVQELFDMLNSMSSAARWQAGQLRQHGPESGPPGPDWLITDQSPSSADPEQEIANAVIASASRFIGRAIGKRLRQTYEERVIPALDARSEQAEGEWEQSRREQAAIVERHPDLRGCLRDQVVFLTGGTRAVPLADVVMPITLAQADALVDRLRAP
jgi:hypothetical protein